MTCTFYCFVPALVRDSKQSNNCTGCDVGFVELRPKFYFYKILKIIGQVTEGAFLWGARAITSSVVNAVVLL